MNPARPILPILFIASAALIEPFRFKRHSALCALWLLAVLAFVTDGVEGKTITVDDDNKGSPLQDGTEEHPFENISAALVAAAENDTIFVFNGTYNETPVITKALNLIGESRESTVINATGNITAVTVKHDFVRLSGFTVENTSSRSEGHGIVVYANHTEFSYLDIRDNRRHGIHLIKSDYNMISNCRIWYNRGNGIGLDYSHNNTIMNCIINDNDEDPTGDNNGIELWSSHFNTITNTVIENNFKGIYGSGYGLRDKPGSGMESSIGSNYNSVMNCTIRNNKAKGIQYFGHSWSIENSLIDNNKWFGIEISGDDSRIAYCTVSNTGIYPSDVGIRVYGCIRTEVVNCTIENSTGSGIFLIYGHDNVIRDCSFIGNGKYGIAGYIYERYENEIMNNHFEGNLIGEISIEIHEDDNTDDDVTILGITGNTMLGLLGALLLLALLSLFVFMGRSPKERGKPPEGKEESGWADKGNKEK